jgi:hypothetical protein
MSHKVTLNDEKLKSLEAITGPRWPTVKRILGIKNPEPVEPEPETPVDPEPLVDPEPAE